MNFDCEKKLYIEPFFEIAVFEVKSVMDVSWDEGIDAGDKENGWGDIGGI